MGPPNSSSRHMLLVLFVYLGGVFWPDKKPVIVPKEILETVKDVLEIPDEYQTVQSETSPRAKSFNCPLCDTVQISRNAKQHLVLRCPNREVTSQDKRETIARLIRNNILTVSNRQLVKLEKFVLPESHLTMKIAVYCWGGVILNADYNLMSIYDMFGVSLRAV
ncbi:uncharacterized protein LOC117654208 [Thrips palmi]|uniref:Uncharacterized protein LOC117654208 n=1 Tax=Thrips palmi TaxID=161013 RepID=A0A6P9ADN4_THRPL|nr:uncharacterized protein LOC117654208 [Thrips palmi]